MMSDERYSSGKMPSPEGSTKVRLAESAHDVPLSEMEGSRLTPMRAGATTAPRRCGRKPSPEKRLRILEAAVRLFTTRDYHEVLVDHIAEQAGVGKGTVYRYFPTKEALFMELVHLAVDRAGEVIRAGVETRDSAMIRLRRAVTMTLEYFRRNEPLLAILYHDKVFRCCKEREDLEKKRAELRGYFIRLLAEGIAEGSVRSDLEPAFGGVMLMATIRGALRNFGGMRSSEQIAEQILSIFLDGAALTAGAAAESMPPTAPALYPDHLARVDPLASLMEMGAEMTPEKPSKDSTEKKWPQQDESYGFETGEQLA